MRALSLTTGEGFNTQQNVWDTDFINVNNLWTCPDHDATLTLGIAIRWEVSGAGVGNGEALVRLWQSLVLLVTEDTARLERAMEDFLGLVREHDYDFLFERKTLLGPPDLRRLVPLLVFARDAGVQRTYAQRLTQHHSFWPASILICYIQLNSYPRNAFNPFRCRNCF